MTRRCDESAKGRRRRRVRAQRAHKGPDRFGGGRRFTSSPARVEGSGVPPTCAGCGQGTRRRRCQWCGACARCGSTAVRATGGDGRLRCARCD